MSTESKTQFAIDHLAKGIDERTRELGSGLNRQKSLEDSTITDLPSEDMLHAISNQRLVDGRPPLPEVRVALRLTPPLPQTLLITPLYRNRSDEIDLLPALWWMALVRARLQPREQADLHCFFVAFVPRDQKVFWSHWKDKIEREPRFCRKHVFLLREESDPSREVETFLDRTFFACPWRIEDELGARSLDPLENVKGLLQKSISLSDGQVSTWLELLADESQKGRDLATGLADALSDEEPSN